MTFFLLVLLCSLAAVVSCVFALFSEQIAKRLNVIDYPDVAGGRKRHDVPTPLTGGIVVLSALSGAGVLYGFAGALASSNVVHLLFIALVSLVFAMIGFIDDRNELSAKIRLFMLFALTATVLLNEPTLVISFLHFSFLDEVFILGPWAFIFTLVALVGLSNAVNMADGKNGLVLGLFLIWSIALVFVGAPVLKPLMAILFVACLIAFVFNMRGLLFLGDTGSFGISAFVGCATIYSYTQNFVEFPAEIAVLMFLVPVLDCLRLMASRVLQGRSPFSAGRDHLHHFLAMTLGWELGLPLYLGLVGLPLFAVMLFPSAASTAILVQMSIYVGLLIVCTSVGRGARQGSPA